MKFTLVFSTDEDKDLSFGLLFIPCPVFVQGTTELINLNPEKPDYRPGSIRRLMEKIPALSDTTFQPGVCALVIHPTGYGTEKDLETLLADLAAEGWQVVQTRLG